MWKAMFVLCVACSGAVSAETKVLAFSGSTRDGSYNQHLVSEVADMARQCQANVTVVNLKDYPAPFYNGDLEAKTGMPAKSKELRQLMIQNDVILIASPEYNASVSAVLKNALDWASRGENGGGSRDAFKGKKFVIMSASPGSGGGARGLQHLKAIIEDVGGTVLAEQIVVPQAYNAFDDQGHLKSAELKNKIASLLRTALN